MAVAWLLFFHAVLVLAKLFWGLRVISSYLGTHSQGLTEVVSYWLRYHHLILDDDSTYVLKRRHRSWRLHVWYRWILLKPPLGRCCKWKTPPVAQLHIIRLIHFGVLPSDQICSHFRSCFSIWIQVHKKTSLSSGAVKVDSLICLSPLTISWYRTRLIVMVLFLHVRRPKGLRIRKGHFRSNRSVNRIFSYGRVLVWMRSIVGNADVFSLILFWCGHYNLNLSKSALLWCLFLNFRPH